MNIDKPRIGSLLAIVCLAILLTTFFYPLWTIDRRESITIIGPDIYVNSTHEFRLLAISTVHKDTHSGMTEERHLETPYSDVEDSDLGLHFLVITLMVVLGAVFIVLLLVLNNLPNRKEIYRLVSLGLGFAVIFLSLGSAAYLNIMVPPAVGDSRVSLETALETRLPNIRSFADTDLDYSGSATIETTWGPSGGWYLFFLVCVIMLVSIWFTESRPRTEEESED